MLPEGHRVWGVFEIHHSFICFGKNHIAVPQLPFQQMKPNVLTSVADSRKIPQKCDDASSASSSLSFSRTDAITEEIIVAHCF